MTGLERLRGMADGTIPGPNMFATVPVRITAIADGRVTLEARADERHLNTMGGIHGGFAATVMDTVTGCAVHTRLGDGVEYATVNLDVRMLRAVPRDEPVEAEGTVVHMSRRIAVADGVIRDQGGRVLARGSATCMILAAPDA